MGFTDMPEVPVGRHAVVRPCYWFEENIRTGRNCYKSYFGVNSRHCMQCAPYLGCTQSCVFCWRDVEHPYTGSGWDDPEEMAEGMLAAHQSVMDFMERERLGPYADTLNVLREIRDLLERKGPMSREDIISAVKASRRRVKRAIPDGVNTGVLREVGRLYMAGEAEPEKEEDILRRFRDARKVKHAAISYTGEPTLYPHIGELVSYFRRKGITTFIVTNGTNPDRLLEMELPSQLYITLPAPDERTYLRTCYTATHTPSRRNWKNIMKTLEHVQSLSARTVIRITAVKGVNMVNPEGYRRLIEAANPNFAEVKAYVQMGKAFRISQRLGGPALPEGRLKSLAKAYRPSFEEVLRFGKEVSGTWSTFQFLGMSEASSYVLMGVNWDGPTEITRI